MSDSISGLSGTGGGDMMRVIGMASGMDIDGMIKKMMLAEQKKVDVVKQQRQAIAWKQEIYQDIIKDVKDLQNTYFKSDSPDNLMSSKAYSDFKVDSTSYAVAMATATVGAVSGNYNVKVEQLAKEAKVSQTLKEGTTLNTKLSDLGITTNFDIEVSFENSKDPIAPITDTKKVTIETDKVTTVKELVDKVKEGFGSNYEVTYSELTREFSIKSKETGSNINITSATGLENLNLSDSKINIQQGTDAIAHITPPGGTETKVIKSTNNFTIDGITYNLQGKSEVVNPGAPTEAEKLGATTITVTPDTDKTFDRFKNFIDKYNALVDKINTKLTEKKNYDFKPLTDDQKKSMKDDEIKAWEEKAKKGILRNDDNLQNMLLQLRSTFFAPVKDGAEDISTSFGKSIGLDTDGTVSKAGQIKFSDDTGEKFKNMLKERPDEIMQLFNKVPDAGISSKEDIYNNSGIFQRISTILKDNVGSPGVTINTAILTKYANKQEDYSIYGYSGTNTLPDQIYRKDNLIKQLNLKLKDKENSLYKKFSALEVVMNKYNAQQGWLAQQFGG